MRNEKTLLLDEIDAQLAKTSAYVVVNYALNALRAHELRQKVRKTGGDVTVVGKRLLMKAAAKHNITISKDTLPGHIAFVSTGADAVLTTKAVYEFNEGAENALTVLCGCFDGQLYASQDVERLSKLPGLDGMRAQFLATLAAPMSETVGVMQSMLTSILYLLENKAKQEAS